MDWNLQIQLPRLGLIDNLGTIRQTSVEFSFLCRPALSHISIKAFNAYYLLMIWHKKGNKPEWIQRLCCHQNITHIPWFQFNLNLDIINLNPSCTMFLMKHSMEYRTIFSRVRISNKWATWYFLRDNQRIFWLLCVSNCQFVAHSKKFPLVGHQAFQGPRHTKVKTLI